MQVTYDGEHSLLIGDFVETVDKYGRDVEVFQESSFLNTWDHWKLIPKERPIIQPPEVQNEIIEVPGSNGVMDFTDVLLGYPLYHNRSGSLDFYVDTSQDGVTWDKAYDLAINELHGMHKKVILTDTRSFYYEGRLSVNSFNSDKMCSTISLDYNFSPFKKMLFTTGEDWLWNPFDFLYGTFIDQNEFYIVTVPANTVMTSEEYYGDYEDWPYHLVFNKDTGGYMPTTPDIILTAPYGFTSENAPDVVVSYERKDKAYGSPTTYTFSTLELNSHNVHGSYIKHDQRITVGCPVLRSKTIMRFENPTSSAVTFTVDFRQGRL